MTVEQSQSEPVLALSHVSKSYAGQPAVRDLSFSVERGAICGFLGPNGAGKTTTLRMILDIAEADDGEIRLFGEPLSAAARERIGFLPEERGLYRKMTPEAVIAFFGRLKGLTHSEALTRARRLLEENGLGEAAKKKIRLLSKGMAQKVQILAAIVHQPEFVILDEPFSGLDPVNQKELEALVRGLRDAGATVLFSTHVMEHAERLCDRIVLIARGRKIFDGGVAEALACVPRQIVLESDAGVDLPSKLEGVNARFEREASDAPETERWRATLENGAGAQEVLHACVASGAPLRLFEPVRPHLHDAFVVMVGEAHAEEDAL